MQNESGQRFYRFTYILILALAMSAAFLYVIRGFILDTLLAAVFAGLLFPLFDRLQRALGGRRALASVAILVVVILAVAVPVGALVAMVASEAAELSQSSLVWIQQAIARPEGVLALLPSEVAVSSTMKAAIASATDNLGDIVNALSGFFSRSLSAFTRGSVGLFLDLFVMAFALVYFLQRGPSLLAEVRRRIPLGEEEAGRIVGKTLQVTAAEDRGGNLNTL